MGSRLPRRLASDALIGARQLWSDPALEKLGECRELRIQAAGLAHVIQRQRQVAQVPRLAVPIPEPRESAEHLDVPLRSDQIEPPQKLRRSAADPTAAGLQQRAIAAHPFQYPRSRPGNVTILEQRHEVVAD